MPKSPWIIDVDALSFASAVVERSKSVPVVLDFHAAWCGPCQTLGPALEALAVEGDGRFLLAKVDVDQNPEISQAFRIQSVPTVIAVVDGRPVDGFQGALPDAELRAFLDGVAPAGPAPASDVLARADELEQAGRPERAIELLREHLAGAPDDAAARLRLAALLLDGGDPDDAEMVLGELSDEQAGGAEARALRTRIAFVKSAGDVQTLRRAVAEDPRNAGARLDLGTALLASQEWAAGLEELLEALRLDPEGVGKTAKLKMVEVFDLLGLEDPVANEYRFKLSLELFA